MVLKKENFLKIFFSIIPLCIILGPAVSLFNTITICLLFLMLFFKELKLKIITSKVIVCLFFFQIYLIFNSFISIDPSAGSLRNFGFFRFIIYFIAINFFFYYFDNSQKIFRIWLIIFSILIFDVYVERFTGSNILGFGKVEIDGLIQPDGDRVVSFFKDEPISGAFISGFIFILSGYILSKLKYNNTSKFLSFLILTIFFVGILITGERSNSIKVFIGFFLFLLVIDHIKIKTKFVSVCLFVSIFSIIISFSDYMKMRYVGQIYLQLVNEDTRSKFFNSLYIQLYKSGYSVFKNYPFFGVGNKNYRVETCDKVKNNLNPAYYCTTHPHQIYFELLSEHGIFGLIIILSLIFFLTFRLLRKILLSKNYIQVGAFIYILINFIPLLPSGAFFNDFNLTLFMINFSIMYAINKETNIFNKNIKGR